MTPILLPIFTLLVGYFLGHAFPLHWIIRKIGGDR